MSEPAIVTLDLGTTRLKVAAFELNGTLLGQVSRRNIDHREGQRRWQSADDWWRDVIDAIAELKTTTGMTPNQVCGLSLSGRAGAGVFLSASGEVVADPWSDERHADILSSLTADLPRTSANYGPTLLAKLLWLRVNRPQDAGRVCHALYGKDFLFYRLTGEAITDPSSGPDGPWPTSLLEANDIEIELLPRVAVPWTIGGTLTRDAAVALGLTEGTPVAVGAHDGICANAGAGAISKGHWALTLGTHAVIRGVSEHVPDGARRFYGYPPDRHVIGGNALFAGRALDWFVDNLLAQDVEGKPDAERAESARPALFTALDRQAGAISPGSHGAVFLPYLRGQIAPERRPDVRAAFVGLSLETDRSVQFRAALEGTGFAVKEVADQLQGWLGEPTAIGVTGSGARSATWTQIIADILGYPLSLTDEASEGRGAAIFCAAALGHYPSVRDAARNMVTVTRTVEPNPANRQDLDAAFERWQSVGRALRNLDGTR